MKDDTLLELAERCEKATGPDRELDCAILAAIDWREPDWEEGERTVREMVARRGLSAFAKSADEGMSIWRHLPRPTASFDAAMTLVPEGFHIAQMGEMRYIASDCPWVVQLDDWQGGEHRFGTRKQGLGKTAALALTAAALRAQAQQVKQ